MKKPQHRLLNETKRKQTCVREVQNLRVIQGHLTYKFYAKYPLRQNRKFEDKSHTHTHTGSTVSVRCSVTIFAQRSRNSEALATTKFHNYDDQKREEREQKKHAALLKADNYTKTDYSETRERKQKHIL